MNVYIYIIRLIFLLFITNHFLSRQNLTVKYLTDPIYNDGPYGTFKATGDAAPGVDIPAERFPVFLDAPPRLMSSSNQEVVKITKVRKKFPETWIWLTNQTTFVTIFYTFVFRLTAFTVNKLVL